MNNIPAPPIVKTCMIKAAAPQLWENREHGKIRWSVLTACGRTLYLDFPKGVRPKEAPCCGRCPPQRPKAEDAINDHADSIPTTEINTVENDNKQDKSSDPITTTTTED